MKGKPKTETHDDYLAGLRDDKRAALEKLRRAIRAASPKAEECMSYQLPAFRLDGKVLVLFGATAKHCSFFPGSGTAVEAHKSDLEGYSTSKGTIRFDADKPLPATLVRKIVTYRIAENAARKVACEEEQVMKPKSKNKANPKTIDEYLAALSDDKRAALERLRKIIRAVAPRAEECISYGLPTFRLDGRGIACFGAAANHCAIYGAVEEFKDELDDYDTSKGTIRFQPDNPPPVSLVRKMVKARVAKNAAQQRHAAAGAARRR